MKYWAFLPVPLSLSGLQKLSIIHYSAVILILMPRHLLILSASKLGIQAETFFGGLTFAMPYFLRSSPSCASISILNLSPISQHLTPLPLHSYHTIALPFFPTLPPLAISLTERDYVEVLMWARLLQISPICQHTTISKPDSDKCWGSNLLTVKI